MQTTPQTNGYLPALDGLRALAALTIVGHHLQITGLSGGFYAVDVFFVLSGYLVTNALLGEAERTGGIDWGGFAMRRLWRLWPALLAVCAALLALSPFLPLISDPLIEVLLAGAYVADFTLSTGNMPVYMIHTWSLAVEMQFYLLWPGVILLVCRWPRERIVLSLLALYAAAALWRTVVIADGAPFARVYFAPDTHCGGLLLGAALAAARLSIGRATALCLGALSTLAIVLLIVSTKSGTLEAVGTRMLLVELLSAGLVLSLTQQGERGTFARLFASPWLVRVGLWSYSLYLIHFPIVRIAIVHLPHPTTVILTLALSIPLAALSYRFVECPARRWYASRSVTAGKVRETVSP